MAWHPGTRAGMKKLQTIAAARWLGWVLAPACAFAQPASIVGSCGSAPQPAVCGAVRGARAEGWAAHSRSEVMAQHSMVVTSQPLPAQVGLQTLMRGGNAIDAAVATAAMLNVVEPMMVGGGGDLCAVIYIAKKKKPYVLNASGTASSGERLTR